MDVVLKISLWFEMYGSLPSDNTFIKVTIEFRLPVGSEPDDLRKAGVREGNSPSSWSAASSAVIEFVGSFARPLAVSSLTRKSERSCKRRNCLDDYTWS